MEADLEMSGENLRSVHFLNNRHNESFHDESIRRNSMNLSRTLSGQFEGDDNGSLHDVNRSSVNLDRTIKSQFEGDEDKTALAEGSAGADWEFDGKRDKPLQSLSSGDFQVVIDGALLHNRNSRFGSISLRVDEDKSHFENGTVVPDDILILTNGVRFREALLPSLQPTSLPSESESMVNPHIHCNEDSKDLKSSVQQSPLMVSEMPALAHLACFGILGVCLRYWLQIRLGPNGAKFTSDQSLYYTDLPANILGSFLMGWFGIAFKKNIAGVSESFALGLTTGFLGSLTTFSGWIQKMINLATQGEWVSCIQGIIYSMAFTLVALIAGILTAEPIRWIFVKITRGGISFTMPKKKNAAAYFWISVASMAAKFLLFILLFSVKFEPNDRARLFLACLVGPFGVWARWFLAKRFNDASFRSRQPIKWLPYGTLIANIGAVGVMAALSTMNFAIKTRYSDMVIKAIQLGFLGCLSTVSTFVQEVFVLIIGSDMVDHSCHHPGDHEWRAAVYILLSVSLSFGVGILVYSIPVWCEGYLK